MSTYNPVKVTFMISLPFFDHRQADPLLRTVLSTASDAVVCEGRDGRVVAVNQRFLDLIDWTEPYTGQPFDDLVAAWTARATHPQVIETYFHRCRTGPGAREPEELQPHQGQVIEARYQTLVQSDGQRLRLWVFQEWRTSALAWVSHEIKNPLNAVLGFSELLQEALGDTNDRAVAESLRGLRIGAKHLHSVLGDLLDLSRLESGVIEPKPEWVTVSQFLEDVAGLYRSRFARRGLEFQLRVPEPRSTELYLDQGRLSQILGNLLSNSLRFTKRGWVSLEAQHEGSSWTFVVEDTGIGVPLDQQKTIFEPFIQQQGQEIRRFGGSGLGLAICRTLAQSLGATMAVESQPGRGSRFSVTFDAIPHRERSEVRSTPPPLPAATLLVADDEPSSHLLIKGFLRETPITVVSAHDGNEALALWKAYRPELVLLDLRMPGLTGGEVAQAILALDATQTKILAMSATTPEDPEGQAPLWEDFIEKPFQKGAFLKLLSKYLTFVDEFAGSP